MYVKSQTVKSPSGKAYTYYRLAESYREDGKVKHRILGELGALTSEEAAKLARRFAGIAGIEFSDGLEEMEVAGASYFGAPLLVEHLMETLNLSRWVADEVKKRSLEFDLLAALKVMVTAHLFKSGSRAELAVWDWQQKLFWHPHRLPDLEYHHFLRALNVLNDIKDKIEEKLYSHLAGLFDLQVDLVLYDLTSTYVEGQASWSGLLKRGYSRDKRGDCKQIVIGLVVTREGFPVTFRVFEGNRLDKKTLDEMVQDLRKRFSIKRCIWVSDAGLLSDENLELLEASRYEYILGMARGGNRKDVQEAFRKTRELEQKEFKQTRFWEVVLASEETGAPAQGGDPRRILVVESDARREKTAAIFERRLEKVRQGFQSLESQVKKGKYTRAEDLRVEAEKILHQSRVKQYFTYQAEKGKLTWKENREAVDERKADAGKYALLARTKLAPEEALSAYRTLIAVEDAFLVLKDILDLRPVWHKCDENVQGHVLLAVWSYLLYKTLEAQLERSEINLTAHRALQAVKEVKAVEVALRDKAVWKLMKVPPEASQVFEAVGLMDVKGRFNQWADEALPYHYQPRTAKDLRAPE
ncbi:MAG: IS1634 family transposase [Planctomycetota bacterium]|nr:IS1634 family transposase [Planctomycetota bacterium]